MPQEGVPSDTDWWKLYKPYNGDLQLSMRAAFIDAGTGDFSVQVYNSAMTLISNGGITPGQNNVPSSLLITAPASVPDSFYVQIYSNSFDCGSYELSYASTYVGIEEEANAHAILVMPNPSNDLFTFQTQRVPISWIQVTDMEGRVVMDRKVGGLATFTWDAAEVGAGSYIARIIAVDGSASTIRLVRTS